MEHWSFPERTALWSQVIENVDRNPQQSGFCTKLPLEEARKYYES
jgi:hypothetical protein